MEPPNDILVEILARLPVKSLLRFRGVSKRFFYLISDLISDPRFAALQHKHSKHIPIQKVLLPTSSCLLRLDCSKTTSFTDPAVLVNLNLPFKTTGLVRIVGSCNGLVCLCLGRYSHFLLWNPCTGAYTKLPDPYLASAREYSGNQNLYGFAYDATSNDYKLFFAMRRSFSSFSHTHVFIYTTNTLSWRKIEHNFNVPGCESYYSHDVEQGFLLNGALHWLITWERRSLSTFDRNGSEFKHSIIAFDIAEENFREVPMPDLNVVFWSHYQYFRNLGILDGCLCLIGWTDLTSVDLWIMRDYGAQSSWEKPFRVVEDAEEFQLPRTLVPLSFTECGEIILTNNGNELIRFNPDVQRIRERVMIDHHPSFVPHPSQIGKPTMYTETLISPKFLV